MDIKFQLNYLLCSDYNMLVLLILLNLILLNTYIVNYI